MDMRHPDGVSSKSVYLPRGSLLVMEGAARYEWSHGIASRKTDMVRQTWFHGSRAGMRRCLVAWSSFSDFTDSL